MHDRDSCAEDHFTQNIQAQSRHAGGLAARVSGGGRGASVYATATATATAAAASSRRRRTLHISGEQIGGGASRKQLGPNKYSSAVIVPRANVGGRRPAAREKIAPSFF